jgi:hypothetical protein
MVERRAVISVLTFTLCRPSFVQMTSTGWLKTPTGVKPLANWFFRNFVYVKLPGLSLEDKKLSSFQEKMLQRALAEREGQVSAVELHKMT